MVKKGDLSGSRRIALQFVCRAMCCKGVKQIILYSFQDKLATVFILQTGGGFPNIAPKFSRFGYFGYGD